MTGNAASGRVPNTLQIGRAARPSGWRGNYKYKSFTRGCSRLSRCPTRVWPTHPRLINHFLRYVSEQPSAECSNILSNFRVVSLQLPPPPRYAHNTSPPPILSHQSSALPYPRPFRSCALNFITYTSVGAGKRENSCSVSACMTVNRTCNAR